MLGLNPGKGGRQRPARTRSGRKGKGGRILIEFGQGRIWAPPRIPLRPLCMAVPLMRSAGQAEHGFGK